MSEASGWQVPDAAPRHYQDQAIRFMEPFADALVEASVVAGDAVLDVACGTGIATRAAAVLAGPAGSVVGSDINGAMLEYAAEVSKTSKSNFEWCEASALDLPFENEQFDAVICQQGVQFFPNSGAGLREMARVTKAGGTLSATVWSELDDSPYLEAMYYMLEQHLDVAADEMAWSSDLSQVSGWFVDGGLGKPEINRVEREVTLPPLGSFVPAHMKATPWALPFAELSEDRKGEAVGFMERHLEAWRSATGVTAPFVSYLARATI